MRRFRLLALLALVLMALGLVAGSLAAASDESSKTPEQILGDAQRDLAKVRSYHFSGTEADGRSTVRAAGDVSASGRADVTIREGKGSVRVILLPAAMYMKANAAFWKANGGADGQKLADKLADRWLKTNDRDLKSLIDELLPKHVASCVDVGTGTLKKGGMASVGGKPTVVVVAQATSRVRRRASSTSPPPARSSRCG
jgi:hypothetical protein